MGYILAYVAILLFTIVYLLDSVVILLYQVKGRKWYLHTSSKSRSKAFKTDIIANWLFPDTWSFLFSKKGGYRFGRFGESLSSCLGRKFEEHTLSLMGYAFYYILYFLDYTAWKTGGHCFISIMSDEQINKFIEENITKNINNEKLFRTN